LKDGISFLFGREDIAQLVEAKDGDFGIKIDPAIEVFGSGEFGGQIKEGDKDCLIAFENCIMADGGCEVGFADSCGANEDQVAGSLEPVGVKELHDLVAGDFGVKGPVEVVKELDSFDPGGPHQILDSLLFSQLILFGQESF
jgi:hypothetical protein